MNTTTAHLNRLTLFRRGAAAAVALGAATPPGGAGAGGAGAPIGPNTPLPGAELRRTWFTPGGAALRPPAPPAGGDDLARVRALTGQRDAGRPRAHRPLEHRGAARTAGSRRRRTC